MASFCDTTIISGAKNSAGASVMEDNRGFMTAGKDYVPPEFSNISPHKGKPSSSSKKLSKTAAAATTTTTTSTAGRLRRFSFPAPVGPISLEELELDSTLKAGESFLSSSSVGSDDEWRGGRRGSCVESTVGQGNGTSYSKAISRGRIESVAAAHLV